MNVTRELGKRTILGLLMGFVIMLVALPTSQAQNLHQLGEMPGESRTPTSREQTVSTQKALQQGKNHGVHLGLQLGALVPVSDDLNAFADGSFDLHLSVGYQATVIADRLAITPHLTFDYIPVTVSANAFGSADAFALMVGCELRYLFADSTSFLRRMEPFIAMDIGWVHIHGKYNILGFSGSERDNDFGLNLSAGVDFRLWRQLYLGPTFRYTHISAPKGATYGSGNGIGIMLGGKFKI